MSPVMALLRPSVTSEGSPVSARRRTFVRCHQCPFKPKLNTALFSISRRTLFPNGVLHEHLVHCGADLAIFFRGQESRHSRRNIVRRMGPGERTWVLAARLVVELA